MIKGHDSFDLNLVSGLTYRSDATVLHFLLAIWDLFTILTKLSLQWIFFVLFLNVMKSCAEA